MIILNILPAEKKHGFAVERTQRLQRKLAVVFLTSLVLSVIILFTTKWYIDFEIKSIDTQIEATQQVLHSRGDNSNSQIKIMNEQISQLQIVQKEHIVWPMVFNQLTDAMVPGVILSGVSFDATIKSVTISGTALTRQDLVSYKEKLSSLSYISDIESPLSDLIQRENIKFQFKGQFIYSIDAQ